MAKPKPGRAAAAPTSGVSRRALMGAGLAGLVGAGALFVLAQAGAGRTQFDRDLAFKHLEKQVAFGPRVPNLDSHVQCRDWMIETLKPLADSVERQDFTERVRGTSLRMSNVIARWKGKNPGSPGVLLCAHWDTRPTADQEFDPEKRKKPILGANDGASGVAVLLEAARVFKQSPPPVPVMIVFFDGEDYGPGVDKMFLGSRYFADHLPKDVPQRGILLDMVGDRDLEIPQEGYSRQKAPEVVDEVYAGARRLGLDRHFPQRPGSAIMDDHLPLHEKGLRVIDLIDFNYGFGNSFWHTHDDTPDKCSAVSLKMVGDVVLEWVYGQK
jgi:Zn-dependent M28 family amino/carboxypeptidase